MTLKSNIFKKDEEIFKGIKIEKVMGGDGETFSGIVYLVNLKEENEYLAIKTLQHEVLTLEDYEKFKKEIIPWILHFRHPYIVEAYSLELDDNKRPILIMEAIIPDEKGRMHLSDFIDEDLNIKQILTWSIQICQAMKFINNKRYTHGDIHSENILIKDGNVKITDFGLSELIENIKTEQAITLNKLDESNLSHDIFTFGKLMFEMITTAKSQYFASEKEMEKYENSELHDIVDKCLNKNPQLRFKSFKEIEESLNEIYFEKYSQKIDTPDYTKTNELGNAFKAHLYAQLGDVEKCKKYYNKFIDKYPQEPIIFQYGKDLISLNQNDDALKIFKYLLENNENLNLDELYHNIGNCFERKNQSYNALIYFKKAINENHENLQAHLNLGQIYSRYGLYEHAFDQFEIVLQKEEDNELGLFYMMQLYDYIGDSEQSNKYLSKLEKLPHNLYIEYQLGVFNRKSNLNKFENSMKTVEKQYYFNIRTLYSRLKNELMHKNLKGANEIFKEIITTYRNDVEELVKFCNLFYEYGFVDECITNLDSLFEYADDSMKNELIFQKIIYLSRNDKKQAIKLCKHLLNKNIDGEFKSDIWQTLGNIIGIENKECIKCFLTSLKYNPQNTLNYVKLAAYYNINGNDRKCRKYLDKGLKISPNDYYLNCMDAYYYYGKEKYEQALERFNKCIKLQPSSKLYHFISKCFYELNKPVEALFYLNLAINISNQFDLTKLSSYIAYYIQFQKFLYYDF